MGGGKGGLSSTDDERDRITASLDRSGLRALAYYAADAARMSSPHSANGTVPLPQLPLGGSEA